MHTNGLLGPVQFDVTSDVQAFLDGTAHHGWLLKQNQEGQNDDDDENDDEDQTGKVEYTAREGTPGQEPRLLLVIESATSDAVPPQLTIAAPTDPVLVNDPTPEIVVDYTEGGTGVDLASLQVTVDTLDVTASCSAGPDSATCESTALAAGVHTLTVTLQDLAGNLATASVSFELLLGAGPHPATRAASADTYIHNDAANQHHGTEPFLRVRQTGKSRALVRFDHTELATLIGTGTLVAATLEFFIEHNANNWRMVLS